MAPQQQLHRWLPFALLLLLPSALAAQSQGKQPPKSQLCPPVTPGGEFRVVALGDSTTEGAVPSKGMSKPYTRTLGEMLTYELKAYDVTVKITQAGAYHD